MEGKFGKRIDGVYRSTVSLLVNTWKNHPARLPLLLVAAMVTLGSVAPSFLNQAQAAYAGRQTKTVEYSFGNTGTAAVATATNVYATDAGTGSTTAWTTTAPTAASAGFNFKLFGSNIELKQAWVEYRATTTAAANLSDFDMAVSTCPGTVATCSNAPVYRSLPLFGNPTTVLYYVNSGEHNVVYLKGEATPAFENFSDAQWNTGVETLLRTRHVGPSLNGLTAKIFFTYELDYSTTAHNEVKTVRFPLDSDGAGDTGSKTASLAAAANQDFSYTADIPDLAANSDILDVYFEITGQHSGTTSSGTLTAKIQSTGANSPAFPMVMALTDSMDSFSIYRPAVGSPNFQPNVAQKLNIAAATLAVNALGGELVVTYKYSTGAATQADTVRYMINRTGTNDRASNVTTKQTATFAPVVSNGSLSVKNIYVRAQSQLNATANLQIFGDIDATGGVTEKSNTYTLTNANLNNGQFRIVYDMSADKASFSSGGNMTVSTQYSATGGDPVMLELFITFTWAGSSGGTQTKTTAFFMRNTPIGGTAGNTAANQWNIVLPLLTPETVTKTKRSIYVETAVVSSDTTSPLLINAGINLDAVDVSSENGWNYAHDGEDVSFYWLKDVTTDVNIGATNSQYVFNISTAITTAYSPMVVATYDVAFADNGTTANARQLKTVEYGFGDSDASGGIASATNAYGYEGLGIWSSTAPTAASDGYSIRLNGTNIDVKQAWFEFRAMATTATSLSDFDMALSTCPGSVSTCSNAPAYDALSLFGNPTTIFYTVNTGEHNAIYLKADAAGVLDGFTDNQWSTGIETIARVKATGPTIANHAGKLIITYESDYVEDEYQVKTVRFPLDSTAANNTGSNNAAIAANASQDFTYNAQVPDLASTSDIYSVFFELNGQYTGTTSNGSVTPQIQPSGSTFDVFLMPMSLGNTIDLSIMWHPSIDANNFQPNTSQTVRLSTGAGLALNVAGGEVVLTYKYSTSAATQTSTVRYFAKQDTTSNVTSKTTTTFAPVISNTGRSVKNIYVRAQSLLNAAANLQVYGDIDAGGAVTEKSNTFTLTNTNVNVGQFRILYDMSADAASFVSGGNMTVSTQYSATGGGPVALELFITFTWSGASGGTQTKTVEFFQRTTPYGGTAAAAATTQWNILLRTYFPESVTKTMRSAYVENAVVGSDNTSPVNINTDINADAITAGGTGFVSYTTGIEGVSFYTLENITSTVDVTDKERTYVINMISDATAAFSSKTVVTYDAAFAAVSFTLSGTCQQYDQSTACTDDGANQIRVAYNGTLQAQVDTTVDGSWSIAGLSAPSSGAVVTVFIDGESTATERAVAVTKYDGGGSISDIQLFWRHLSIGSNDNQTLTNTNLSSYDNSVSGDADIFFEVNATDDLNVDTGGAYTDEELYVASGDTFQPASAGGADVTTAHIEIVGTWTADSNTITMNGTSGTLFTVSGTFTEGTSLVVFNGDGSCTLTGNTTEANSFSRFNMTPTLTADRTYTFGTSTLTTNNTTTHLIQPTAASSPTKTLTVQLGGTTTFGGALTLGLSSGNAIGKLDTTSNNYALNLRTLSVDGRGELTANGSTITIPNTGAGGSVFSAINGGVINAGTSTLIVTITGSSADITPGTNALHNVQFSPALTSDRTYTLGNSTGITLTGNLDIIPTATSTTRTFTVNLGGNLTVAGTTTINAGDTNSPNATLDLRPSTTDRNFTTGSLILGDASGGADTLDATGAASTITFTGSGTPFVNNGTLNVGSSTISYEGTSATNVNSMTYNHLQFNPGSGTPTYTLGSATASAAVNISDAADFGSLVNNERSTVRTSSGTLYTFLNDAGSCQMWKSNDGTSWSNVGTNQTCGSGDGVSAAINNSSTISVTYTSATGNANIVYNTFNTGTDAFGTSENAVTTASSDPSRMELAMDSNNKPHIAYVTVESLNPIVRYTNKVGVGWRAPVTVMGSSSPDHMSIVIDEDNVPLVAYQKIAASTTSAAVGNANDASSFTSHDIDTSGIPTGDTSRRGTSIVVDSSGNTWVAYSDGGGTDIVTLAKRTDGSETTSWTTGWSTVNNSITGGNISLAVNGTDIYLFFEDSGDDIAYDKYDGSSWNGKVVLYSGTYQEVKVKEGQYNDNQGGTQIDFVFSDNTDVYWGKLTLAGPITANNFTLVNSGGTATVTATTRDIDLDINGDFAINKGTFTASDSAALNIGGSFSNCASCTFTHSSATVTMDAGSTGKTLTTNGDPFYNLTFSNSSGGWTFSDNVTIANIWSITAGTVSGGSATITLSASGTPFINNGTFTPASSTVSYEGTSATNAISATYHNIQFNPGSGTPTYTLGGADGTPTKVDDASNFGSLGTTTQARRIVRTSGGNIYTFLRNPTSGVCEIWKSTDGTSWTEQDTADSPACASGEPTIAVDSSNSLHLAYLSSSPAFEDIVYRTYSTSTDQFGTAENAFDGAAGDSSSQIAMALDSSNKPHIAFIYDASGPGITNVSYTNKTGAGWATRVTAVANGTAATPDIATDTGNIPIISYRGSATVFVANGDANNATSFTANTVDSTTLGVNPSLAFDSSGNAWVAYLDETGTTDYVSLIKHNSGDSWATWQSPVHNSNAATNAQSPSVAVNGTNVYIIYIDENNDVAVDMYNGSTWLGESILATGTYSTPRAKWSRVNNNGGSTQLDFLYSDGTDVYWSSYFIGSSSLTANDFTLVNASGTPTVNVDSKDPTLDINGNFSVNKGTFIASNTAALTIGGSFTNCASCTFTHSNNAVNFDGTTTGKTIATNGDAFDSLYFTGNGGEWTLQDALTARLIGVAKGTLLGSSNITVAGVSAGFGCYIDGVSTTTCGTVNLSGGTVEYRIEGSGGYSFGQDVDSFTQDWTFNNLTFHNQGSGDSTVSTQPCTTCTGKVVVNGTLQVGKNTDTFRTDFENDFYDHTLDINGNVLTTSKGALIASSSASFTLAGNWTKESGGVFTHSNGELTIDGSGTTTFSGPTTFYKLKSTTGGKTLAFTAGETFTIATGGLLTVTGSPGNQIHIHSTTTSQWFIDHEGTESVTYAHIDNSGCDGTSTQVDVSDGTSTNGGNNGTCWNFGGGSPTFDQAVYRFGSPGSGTAVSYTGAPSQDAAYTTSGTGDDFRLRLIIHVGTANLSSSGQAFKLKFGEKTAATCSSGVSWSDVSDSSGVIRYYNGSAADGATINSVVGDPSHSGHTKQYQTYEEVNNFTNSVSAINAGEDGVWDFSLVNNSAVGGKRYCFKVTKSDDTDINTYTVYPEVIVDEELIFSLDATSKDFGVVQPGANPADVTSTLTTSTNSSTGYIVYAWSTQEMTLTNGFGTFTLSDWSGTNQTPTTWSNGSFGFGYSTDDAALTCPSGQICNTNRFVGPKFAGFVHAGPSTGSNQPVADRTSGPVTGSQDQITYRLASPTGQQAGKYQTVVIFVAAITF